MLTPKPQLSLKNAKEYFREHLCVGDYYAQGQQVAGEWLGLGSETLGLKGKVGENEFLRMCDGLHPETGERLTQRMNSERRNESGQTVANRRVFYDFTISPPKSVSVVALLQDSRIIEIHDRAVRMAMVELEQFAESRIRKSGERAERATKNLVTAAFRHDTSRELDPHLHTHCVVLNATFDAEESRWKALEVQGMYRAQKYAENLYYHELSKGLRSLGYEIENNTRDFEIKGVPASILSLFSKRHQQIDEEAGKRLEEAGGDRNTVRRQIARDARKRKIKDSTAEQLRPTWWKQLDSGMQKALEAINPIAHGGAKLADVGQIIDWADEHVFERKSVVRDFDLLSAALARGRGDGFELSALKDALDRREYVREQGTRKLTSKEVLRCELDVVLAAKNGRGRHEVLASGYASSPVLSAEQTAAVQKILGSRDLITLFRGGAGTGKSFTLKEIERGLLAAHRPVIVLAPQRQQVRDLQSSGLTGAETLARFLQAGQLPTGSIVIVDEAGQIGGKQLRELIRLVKAKDGRLILSGDTRQHGAVASSDALRAIEKHAGIKPAVIQSIRRQDPKLGKTSKQRGYIRGYRAAVKAASEGAILDSYDRLDRLECIFETKPENRHEAVAEEFMAAADRKETTLVIAQTWEEVNTVNEAVRTRLQETGKLGAETTLKVSCPLDLGEAQKRDPRFYQPGQQVFFMKPYGRFKKGDLCEIAASTEHGVVLLKDGRRSTFSFRYSDRIVVSTAAPMALSTGDRLQLKFNGKSQEGASLNNGELVTVHRVRDDGAISVVDDTGAHKTLDPSQRLFVRGYAVTSYASQGKTVDTVILSDAIKRGATSAEQWYVTISRGRKRAMVFTSDKAGLRRSIAQNGKRELALDLTTPVTAIPEAQREIMSKGHGWKQNALSLIDRVRRQGFIKSLRPKSAITKQIRVKV